MKLYKSTITVLLLLALTLVMAACGGRVFAEVSRLGQELGQLAALAGSARPAQVGVLFSYENVWALELDSKPATMQALEVIRPWYDALLATNAPLDFVHPDDDLSRYRVLLAPLLYQMTAALAEALRRFVAGGGTLIVTYFSGIVDEQEQIWLGGYPGLLQDVLGLVVEEWQPLLPEESVGLRLLGDGATARGTHWVDLLHTTPAETLASFTSGFFAGRPAITRHAHGRGVAYYVATRPDEATLTRFFDDVLRERDIRPPLAAPPAVQATERVKDGQRYLFVINHAASEAAVDMQTTTGIDLLTGRHMGGQVALAPYDVLIIKVDIAPDGAGGPA